MTTETKPANGRSYQPRDPSGEAVESSTQDAKPEGLPSRNSGKQHQNSRVGEIEKTCNGALPEGGKVPQCHGNEKASIWSIAELETHRGTSSAGRGDIGGARQKTISAPMGVGQDRCPRTPAHCGDTDEPSGAPQTDLPPWGRTSDFGGRRPTRRRSPTIRDDGGRDEGAAVSGGPKALPCRITAKSIYYVLCIRQASQGGVRVKNIKGGDFKVSASFDDAADYGSLVNLCNAAGILSVDLVLGHAVFTVPRKLCDLETQVRFERAAHGKWEV